MVFRFAPGVILGLLLLSFSASGIIPSSSQAGTRPILPSYLPLAAVNGPQRTIVITVRFSDQGNTTSLTQIQTTVSTLNSYYNEDSYGTVSFQTSATPSASSPWYTLPNAMTYYGADTVSSDNQLVSDSLQAAYNAGVDFSTYRFAIVVHAGNDEAMSHVISDIHSFTIPSYVFNPAPLISYKISTSVVAESDPTGVYCHEAGHLLGLPDLYDLTGRIDPTNNFLGYWEIMALGEWNPNNGNPLQPKPGTFPSHHSIWSKLQLGFVSTSSMITVQPGQRANVTLENLESRTSADQAVKIPIAANSDGSLTYYLLEMRARIGVYDQYLPFPSDYPGAGILIYKVNESIPAGQGSVRLIDAHPGGDLSDAPFGPCNAPCVSNNTFWDQGNFVKVIVTTTTPIAYSVLVDRTAAPLLLLEVNTPAQGIQITVDGANLTSDPTKQVRVPVHYGPHQVSIQSQIPVSLGSTSVQIGLADSFASWDDGNTANPRWVSVAKDTVLTASYRIIIEPSFATAVAAAAILGTVMLAATLDRRRRNINPNTPAPTGPSTGPGAVPTQSSVAASPNGSLPGNDGLPGVAVNGDNKPNDP
jgi:M6 family metalloprotease-like protein